MQTSTQEPPPPEPTGQKHRPADEEERLARAQRRLAALKGFYVHLFVFAMVLAGLAIVNLSTGGPWWVLWVLLGWGIGIVAHAMTVLGRSSQALANWEERKLGQFMDER